jgi:hypothetical protein
MTRFQPAPDLAGLTLRSYEPWVAVAIGSVPSVPHAVSDLDPLAPLVKLQRLDISCDGVSDLAPLAVMPNLETLNMGYCSRVSDFAPLGASRGHGEAAEPVLGQVLCV